MNVSLRCLALLSALAVASACKKETPPPPAAPAPAAKPSAPVAGAPKVRRRSLDPRQREGQGAGIEFHRGKYLQQLPDNDGQSAAKRFGALPEDMKAELEKLITQAKGKPGKEEALKLIDQAREFHSTDVFPLIEALLAHPDADVRGNALSMLEGIQDEKALGIASLALKDTDPEVRLQAIEATGRIVAPETAPVLKTAFKDADLSVRQLAFQTALRQSDATKMALIEDAIHSPYEDLAQASLGMVEAEPAQATITLMMEALSNPSAAIREKAHDTLYLLFHEDFTSTPAAKGWWSQNHRRYDDNLVLKSP